MGQHVNGRKVRTVEADLEAKEIKAGGNGWPCPSFELVATI